MEFWTQVVYLQGWRTQPLSQRPAGRKGSLRYGLVCLFTFMYYYSPSRKSAGFISHTHAYRFAVATWTKEEPVLQEAMLWCLSDVSESRTPCLAIPAPPMSCASVTHISFSPCRCICMTQFPLGMCVTTYHLESPFKGHLQYWLCWKPFLNLFLACQSSSFLNPHGLLLGCLIFCCLNPKFLQPGWCPIHKALLSDEPIKISWTYQMSNS